MPAEARLVDSIEALAEAEVTDLVLDMRYNGGGFLDIANLLAYMIAGPVAQGQVFGELQFNDKHRQFNPVTGARLTADLFHSTTLGWSTPVANESLPSLDLNRVFVLSGPRTCSASEAIINGLRGIGVEVVLIGATTCGKPYGFYPQNNCGTTYSTVQFRGVNALGFGDYSDGFSPANVATVEGLRLPGCVVADDFLHQFGDPAEARLNAALRYRRDASCPPPDAFAGPRARASERPGVALLDSSPGARGEMIAVPPGAPPRGR